MGEGVRENVEDLLPGVLAAMMPHVALVPDVARRGFLGRQGGRVVRLSSVGRHACCRCCCWMMRDDDADVDSPTSGGGARRRETQPSRRRRTTGGARDDARGL